MVDTDNTRRTIDDRRRATPGVWHKLPTGDLKTIYGGRITQHPHASISKFMELILVYIRYVHIYICVRYITILQLRDSEYICMYGK